MSEQSHTALRYLIATICFAVILFLTTNTSYTTPASSARQQGIKLTIKESNQLLATDECVWTDKTGVYMSIEAVKRYITSNITYNEESDRLYLDYDDTRLNFLVTKVNGVNCLNILPLERLQLFSLSYPDPNTVMLEKQPSKTKKQPAKLALSKQQKWQPQGKITLVWDHVGKIAPALDTQDKISGLDVISPTWFAVIDENGHINNNADSAYVTASHNNGYQVWALITNSFNPDLTHTILNSEQAQDNIIKQLLLYATMYHLDGINIDFENIYDYDKDKLTAFATKLAGKLQQHNLVVSMDITVPSDSPNWSKCYDRQKLGEVMDYIMVMTYDEYWSKGPVSGSVASLPWVEAGLNNTLTSIPSEKLIMGIPFYTRQWEETTNQDGTTSVKSKTMSMAAVQKAIDENGLHPNWLGDAGQNYVEYSLQGKTYKIWIEDAKSIALKARLVTKYNLAGAAAWRKGFETPNIWNILNYTYK